MKKLLAALYIILLSPMVMSKELTFFPSELLRHQEADSTLSFMILQQNADNPYDRVVFDTLWSKDTFSLLSDINSKDEGRISRRIERSYGTPSYANAKWLGAITYKRIRLALQFNEGIVAIGNDPVFPEFYYFHSQSLSTNLKYHLDYDWKSWKLSLIPSVTFGQRRILNSTFSAIDLANKVASTKISKTPWDSFANFHFYSHLDHPWIRFMIEARNLGLYQHKNQIDTHEVRLGMSGPNLLGDPEKQNEYALKPFIFHSILSAGLYNKWRSLRVGLEFAYKSIHTRVFNSDAKALGLEAGLNTDSFTLALWAMDRYFDNSYFQKTRLYGLQFSFLF